MSPASYLTAPPRVAASMIAPEGHWSHRRDAVLALVRLLPRAAARFGGVRGAARARAVAGVQAAVAGDRLGARPDRAHERRDRAAPPGGRGERHAARGRRHPARALARPA